MWFQFPILGVSVNYAHEIMKKKTQVRKSLNAAHVMKISFVCPASSVVPEKITDEWFKHLFRDFQLRKTESVQCDSSVSLL